MKFADPRCVFNVVLRDNNPVGVLRYDWREGEQAFEVSILIAAEWQGQGIASAALTLGRQLLPNWPIIAEVDPGNVASVSLFERAGYRRLNQHKYALPPLEAAASQDRTAASVMGLQ